MVKRVLLLMLALAGAAAAAPVPPPVVPPPPGVVTGHFVFPDRPPWAGEVFTLRLVWQVNWDLFRYLEGDLGWSADPLVIEGWTREPPGTPRPEGNRTIADVAFTTRAASLAPGSIMLQPATQQMQIVTGSYETSGVTIATIGPVLARGAGATQTIRPLPPAPPTFTGAVGNFTLRSSVDTASVDVGKPIAWTVTLSGTGNWTGFGGVPSRPLPQAFDMVGKPEESPAKVASLFERSASETITVVPRQAGTFTLGPVEMTVFDPDAGRFRTIAAPAVQLVIKPGATGTATPRDQTEPAYGQTDKRLPPALPGIGHARAPLARWAWNVVLATPLLALSLLWLGLAAHRALKADPERAARLAHVRLSRTVAKLTVGSNAALRRKLVRDWQRDAGIRLKIDHAAPTPGIVRQPSWARLWDEADHHLYGADVPLPADWPARAASTMAEGGAPPRLDLRRIFTAANLWPRVAALSLIFASVPAPLGASDVPRQQTVTPLDWIGHYNNGRHAAAAKDWQLAAAHACIAWVQQPRSAETTALWTLAAREAGVGGRATNGLPMPVSARGALTGLLPPFGWQAITMAAVLLMVGGFGTVLLWRFGHAPHVAMRLGMMTAGVGMLGGGIGWAGVYGYGAAAAPDAVITWRQVPLRSLPVDTPDADVMTILEPGTVGHRGGAFIGWSQLTLGDGRSGWVRREALMPFWEPQPRRLSS